MFMYLSKKMAMSSTAKITCLHWSKDNGTIAAGTEDGLIKLLKLDNSPPAASSSGRQPSASTSASAGQTKSGQLSLNQTLTGHQGIVTKVSWNEKYSKLITADETGLIIVWVHYKGGWFEEMVTRADRKDAADYHVSGLKWSPDGEIIAMLFSGHPYSASKDLASYKSSSSSSNNGHIIVGTVGGSRLWEKDLKASCDSVEWSPDSKLILIGVLDIEIIVMDNRGEFLTKINVQSVAFDSINISEAKNMPASKTTYSSKMASGDLSKIVAIEWSNLFLKKPSVPTLAIAFESGRIQIMRNEYDDQPLVINSEIINAGISWNAAGNYLGVCGYTDSGLTSTKEGTRDDQQIVIKFFDVENYGDDKSPSFLINTLRVPGKSVSEIDWDADGLRLCIGVDACVMFASVRPEYKWAWFDETCVFERSSSTDNKSDLIFWKLADKSLDADIDADFPRSKAMKLVNIVTKSVSNLITVAGSGHYCTYASLIDQPAKDAKRGKTSSSRSRDSSPDANNLSRLTICNTLGTPVDSLDAEFVIRSLAINSKFVIAAGKDSFLVWKFNHQDMTSEHDNDLDNLITDTASTGFDRDKRRSSLFGTNLTTRTVGVPDGDILTISCSESLLITAQKTKVVSVYSLPKLILISAFEINSHAVRMFINSDSSKMALIDACSIVSFYDLENMDSNMSTVEAASDDDLRLIKDKVTKSAKISFEKKDVWNMKWASDDPDSFALLEKNKLIIYREFEAEESGGATGYLASFTDLEIRTIDLDTLVNDIPISDKLLALSDFMQIIETKPLKDARDLIDKEGVTKAMEMIEKSNANLSINNHPKIWRLLAKESLNQLNLSVAEHSFVRLKDYKSIQFIKRLSNLSKEEFKRAEILAYLNDLDAAEKVYLDIDRKDLAIRMRKMMGQPLQMLNLIKSDNHTSNISDAEMKKIYSDAGDYLFDRYNYRDAIKYYKDADNLEKMFTTFMCLEDFDAMSNLIISRNLDKEYVSNDVSSLSPEFKLKLARVFESVGMISEAVKVYLSLDLPDDAVLASVKLNDWKLAIKLANDYHDVTDIDQLLNKYASHLMDKKKYFEIIELYRKASRIYDATSVILKLIQDAKNGVDENVSDSDLVLMKKLYTLIGILSFEEKSLSVSERREQLQTARSSRSASGLSGSNDMVGPPPTAPSGRNVKRGVPPPTASSFGRKKSLASLLASDEGDAPLSLKPKDDKLGSSQVLVHRTLDNPWRGSEAFHLMLLSQRLLIEGTDRANELALKCALRLPDYEDYLNIEDIYSILASTAIFNRRYDIASKAFIKLESSDEITEDKKLQYTELALSLFSQNAPKFDRKKETLIICSYCESKIPDISTSCPSCSTKFPFCTASGISITDPSKSKSCERCNHKVLINYDHVFNYTHCPLCHYCI